MFKKFLINNVKKRFLQYIIIILCQVSLITVILSASGILLDSLSKKDGLDSLARYFIFGFEDRVHIGEIHDKLAKFSAECPCGIEYSFMSVKSDDNPDKEYDEYGFLTHPRYIYFYPSYQHLQKYMENLNVAADMLPTEQQFNERQKVVILGNDYGLTEDGKPVQLKYTDENHILIEGEEYLISGSCSGDTIMIWGNEQKTLTTQRIHISTIDTPTEEQINEINNLFYDIFGEENEVTTDTLPEFQTYLSLRKNAANIVISLLLIILTVFNIILIYNQMVICRKTELAVFSFCGFKKSTGIMYCMAELLIILFFSSTAACIIFDVVIKPMLNTYYSFLSMMFTVDYYIILILGYFVSAVLMFLLFIAPTLKKSVSEQLRSI